MRGIHRRLVIDVTDALRERFARYVKVADSGCHLWNGATRNSYGAIKHQGRVLSAHCVAWSIAGPEFIEGHVIAHKCDVKTCVNIDHLESISVAQNNRDGVLRSRNAKPSGSQLPQTVLTQEVAERVIELYRPRKFGAQKIASLLGLSFWNVKSIIDCDSWTHLPRPEYMRQPSATYPMHPNFSS